VAYASKALTTTEQRYAQVEKEALASTWACEHFHMYVYGKEFQIETDHKPLVSLLGKKLLDDLPPRVLRFRLRLMKYSYTVYHVPGKRIYTADTLSRAPLSGTSSVESKSEDTAFVDSIIESLPATEKRLQEIREHLENDEVLQTVMGYCKRGWPDLACLQSPVQPYWQERDTYAVEQGLLLKGNRLIIPADMRVDVLDRIHDGHLGITKCRLRAKQAVWWPGLSKQLETLVTNCYVCSRERTQRAEPMVKSTFPARPWQKVGSDLFQYRGQQYLLVVDYYSRYIEIAKLSYTTSPDIVVHLKSMFARHGIPEVFISDNGPQYSAHTFREFMQQYGTCHITSSPRYPQGNSEAERAVQTIENLLKKAKDPYLALLAYRTTPLENGSSPAELLMGRRLRNTLPMIPSQLDPLPPPSPQLRQKEEEMRMRAKINYDSHHGARPLPQLQPEDSVYIPNMKTPGTVVQQRDEPRSYNVSTPSGILRRNRRQLITDVPPPDQVGPRSASQSADALRHTVSPLIPPLQQEVRRSERLRKPPQRLDL
jgi:transposase InsO family protein